jgi:hypothetical protein
MACLQSPAGNGERAVAGVLHFRGVGADNDQVAFTGYCCTANVLAHMPGIFTGRCRGVGGDRADLVGQCRTVLVQVQAHIAAHIAR